LEGDAARAEGAQLIRDDLDAFRTVPLDDSQSNVASVRDCVDSTNGVNTGEVLVDHPDLAALGPEACPHYNWAFNFTGLPVKCDLRDRRGSSVPVNLPDVAAIFTRHDHVVAKCAHMVESNPGMVR
jgi:hypothetical protein